MRTTRSGYRRLFAVSMRQVVAPDLPLGETPHEKIRACGADTHGASDTMTSIGPLGKGARGDFFRATNLRQRRDTMMAMAQDVDVGGRFSTIASLTEMGATQ
ncbi:MAG TPA: hypothetical protein VJT73_12615, partial [Polyangiaceae bacterium]|nr:hypothetical protein [Polyangiaceae bacterium]